MSDRVTTDILGLTARIVTAHLSGNRIAPDALPALIQGVYQSLSSLGTADAPPVEPVPAVPVRKSIFPDYIVCLEDGKQLKMLKRHLQSHYGMTPDAYRAKWGLPASYPMVAPNYARHRSNMAKTIGLGRKADERPQLDGEPAMRAEPSVQKLKARRAKGSRG
jgi:predicted transcriptional regulator